MKDDDECGTLGEIIILTITTHAEVPNITFSKLLSMV
jgi:hypothetical protein